MEDKYAFTIIISSLSAQRDLWITDIGADHIVCSLNYFDNCKPVNNVLVNLPNDIPVQVTHVCHIKLHNSIWLKDVLYVPSFNFNIVSVSRLLNTTNCSILFSADQCLI